LTIPEPTSTERMVCCIPSPPEKIVSIKKEGGQKSTFPRHLKTIGSPTFFR
jgi:hypothetical protein